MFRQIHSDETLAYKKHAIPGRIYATEYDLGSQDIAYRDADFANTGKGKRWNSGYCLRNDGVDIQACADGQTNGFEVFDIQEGEWLLFTVEVKTSGTYDLAIRYSGKEQGGRLHLKSDDKPISEGINLPATAEESLYEEVLFRGIKLDQGSQRIKVVFDKGGFQLNFLEFRSVAQN